MAQKATMRAWQYNAGGDSIENVLFLNNTADRPPATPANDEILVQVVSAAINPVDYKVIESPIMSRALMVSKPAVPGLDYCGRVVASGSGIDTIVNGTLVFGRLEKPSQFGTLGEYILVQPSGCVTLPSGVSPDHAAAIGTAGVTAYQCIVPNVKNGDHVFINGGSGGTGLFGIQIAKALGCKVTATCSTTNVALCKEMGADEVINYATTDLVEALKAKGQIYSLVVDNVGSPDDLYVASDEFLLPQGKYVQVAGEMTASSALMLMKRSALPSFLGGGKRAFQFLMCENNDEHFTQIGQWMSEGKVKAHIDTVYKFTDVISAFTKLKTGRTKGKLVIQVSE